MDARIEAFPDIVIEQLVNVLDARDILALSQTCKSLHSIFTSQEVWKSKTIHEFGNLFHVYTIFTTATGLELAPDLAQKFSHEPSDWRAYYLKKNASAQQSDDDALMDQADKEYREAQSYLKTFQNDGSVTVLNQVASKMLWILDVFPGHAGCYYILGFILFVLNQLEDAMILLQMARAVDPDFDLVDDLEGEIERILHGYNGDEHGPSLLENDSLSKDLAEVLVAIFKKFDKDNDGALRPEELDSFIFATNGSHPPAPFLRQMGQRFGCNSKGWLTRDGFLVGLHLT
ncbi:uncharacterized protein BYT42DRAFT_548904 [Radiomyces spectabilis]|uniref:uncharacterized protein n=1 Tax=Radiomyces spectabilis TaxID=64574 RepID=UPI00221ED1AA|nr:uncharacterized protein BYT42DRAFT_548904 [Radiomyces spectabilis]KAI8370681.1 hypothetical protein BYT42DRAFT_548904 [Radiomyces spectabilis]